DEGPDARAVPDDWEHPFAHRCRDIAIGGEPRSRPVEVSVAQCNPFNAIGAQYRLFEIAYRLDRLRLIGRRRGIEWIILGLGRGSASRVIPVAITLDDEPPRACRLGRRQQIVRSLRTQPV